MEPSILNLLAACLPLLAAPVIARKPTARPAPAG